ncbi:MAG TPA: type II toxin-antitoxin system VapC family toxin [Candidatus Limnocylindrales bacterium]|nr:type II toxin-antitoxin system VapC family toxin [Candidatus Limnocylindrales bacterium]
MQCLLDTHASLWFVTGSPQLNATTKSLLEHESTEAILSIASVWELAIKHSLGRLNLSGEFGAVMSQLLRDSEVSLLPITEAHCQIVAELPFHHRDPFDRMIAAQALADRLPLVSADKTHSQYGVERLW